MFIIFAEKQVIMPRPKRMRRIDTPPVMAGFKPFGIPMGQVSRVMLLYEEYEAIRLADHEHLTQEEAAERMQVSRPTFTRIYEKARKTVAEALVECKAIIIEGGSAEFREEWYRCGDCHRVFRGSGKKQHHCIDCDSDNTDAINQTNKNSNTMDTMNEGGLGREGYCICPHCNQRVPHQAGIPCRDLRCPECGKRMVREGGYHHRQIEEKKIRRQSSPEN
jgi:uncharacterized protein